MLIDYVTAYCRSARLLFCVFEKRKARLVAAPFKIMGKKFASPASLPWMRYGPFSEQIAPSEKHA